MSKTSTERIALGINIGHDRSAAIIKNGEVLGVVAQERIDRIKHSSGALIAFECIDKLLQYVHLTFNEIDCIGFSGGELDNSTYIDYLSQSLFSYYKCENKPLYMIDHHKSHAEAVFSASGFDHALILIADGGGDYNGNLCEAESLFVGKDTVVTHVDGRYQTPMTRHMKDTCNHIYSRMPELIRNKEVSISRKYEQITYLLGFGWGEAGKTMGLASYGKSLFEYNYDQYDDFNYHIYAKDILKDIYAIGLLSDKGYLHYITEHKADIAQTVQKYTEEIFIHFIQKLIHRYNEHNICLGGGLFLNADLKK